MHSTYFFSILSSSKQMIPWSINRTGFHFTDGSLYVNHTSACSFVLVVSLKTNWDSACLAVWCCRNDKASLCPLPSQLSVSLCPVFMFSTRAQLLTNRICTQSYSNHNPMKFSRLQFNFTIVYCTWHYIQSSAGWVTYRFESPYLQITLYVRYGMLQSLPHLLWHFVYSDFIILFFCLFNFTTVLAFTITKQQTWSYFFLLVSLVLGVM